MRRCSMSARSDGGKWSCGSGDCMGKREDCEAKFRNEWEAAWLERQTNSWETAWLAAYGLPTPTFEDARTAYSDAR